jgi:hypothetical protein
MSGKTIRILEEETLKCLEVLQHHSWKSDKNFNRSQCSKWVGIRRYTIRKLLFMTVILAPVNTYHIHLSFSVFLTVYPCLVSKKNTGTSKFRYLALAEITNSKTVNTTTTLLLHTYPLHKAKLQM